MYYIINARTGLVIKPMQDKQQAIKESDVLTHQTGIAHFVRGGEITNVRQISSDNKWRIS